MKNPSLEFEPAGADYHLMEDLMQRRPDALVALRTRFKELVRGVALQVLGNDADADEVAQEVFVQLWQRPESYCAAKGNPNSWLVTIARRRAIDQLRRRYAYRGAVDRMEAVQRSLPQENVGGHTMPVEAARHDLRNYLLELITHLPPAQQVVVERIFFDGMSQRQVAAALHVPLGTIKTRYELGLKKLTQAALPSRAKIE